MSVRLRGLIGLHKKCGLAAASALLAFVLLVGFTTLAQGVPSQPGLATPENEELTNNNTPYFSWDNLTGENITNYWLVVDNDINFADDDNFYDNSNLIDNFDDFDTHSENALDEGTWYWRVKGENADGPGAWSETWILTVDTLVPSAPTMVSPENNENTNDNTPNLDWDTVTDNSTPVLYHCYISDNSEFPHDNYDSGWILDDNYQLPSELTEGWWYWHVMAKDNAGNESDNSDWWRFQVDVTAPSAPTLVSPDDGTRTADSTPTLSWNTVSDNSLPVTYDIQVDDNSGFPPPTENVSGLTSNSHTTSSLADGTWYWHARAKDNAGNVSSWSSSRSFTVDTTALAAPALTAPANGAITNDSTPICDWESVSGAASYALQYATDSGFTQNLTTGSSTTTDYTPTAALADGTWYWRVRTVDAYGNVGDWSSAWSFTIDTATPTVTISPSLEATPTATGWTLTTTNSSIEISGSVTDATGMTVRIDDEVVTFVEGSFRKTVDLMVLGTNTFTIAVTDAAGNTTTRTLSVIRAGVEPPPVAEPAISSEQAVFIVALVALFIVLMVFVKTALVKKY